MEYEIDRRRSEKKAAIEKVVQTYMRAKSWAEFEVDAAAKGLSRKAPKAMQACGLFWFKHMHPIVWNILICGGPLICGTICFGISLCLKSDVSYFGIACGVSLVWIVSSCIYWLLYGKVFRRLEWLESLKSKNTES